MTQNLFDPLLTIVHASAAFQLLRAGIHLRLFEIIGESNTVGFADLVARIPASTPRGEALVRGLLAIGLLEEDTFATGHIRNSPPIRQILERQEWAAFRALVDFQSEIVSVGQSAYLASLAADTNSGIHNFAGEGDTLYARLSADDRLRTAFFSYMQSYSHYAARYLVSSVDFSNTERLLDVGGGGGALGAAILAVAPDISIDILDIAVARDTFAAQLGVSEAGYRIRFHECDIHHEAFPSEYDDVLFAHQLVIWSADENIALLKKAYTALRPAGRVVIFSSVVDDNFISPSMAALDTIYFQTVASGVGRVYAFCEYKDWLTRAGFVDIVGKRVDTWTPHGIVTARRPPL